MERKNELMKILNDLEVLLIDLTRLVIEYDTIEKFNAKYIFHWKCQERCWLQRIAYNDQYLYVNCTQHDEIYRYSLDGKLIDSLSYQAHHMEIINNQFYLLNNFQFFIIDIKTITMIQSWNLPKEKDKSVGGWYGKFEQEKIYFTPYRITHYVYLFNKDGKKIQLFGSKEPSLIVGQFNTPYGITVNERYLYVCDCFNHRVQVLDRENGKFILLLKDEQKNFHNPQMILLDEELVYIGDNNGIQVWTKESKCIQRIGCSRGNEGEFRLVRGFCIVNDKIYIVDHGNSRIQVWN